MFGQKTTHRESEREQIRKELVRVKGECMAFGDITEFVNAKYHHREVNASTHEFKIVPIKEFTVAKLQEAERCIETGDIKSLRETISSVDAIIQQKLLKLKLDRIKDVNKFDELEINSRTLINVLQEKHRDFSDHMTTHLRRIEEKLNILDVYIRQIGVLIKYNRADDLDEFKLKERAGKDAIEVARKESDDLDKLIINLQSLYERGLEIQSEERMNNIEPLFSDIAYDSSSASEGSSVCGGEDEEGAIQLEVDVLSLLLKELKELRKSPKEKLVDQKALSASGIDSILHDLKAARSEVTDATNGALMAQKKMKSIEQSITKAEKENVARLNVSDYGSNSFKRDTNLDDAFNAKKEKLLESLELSKVGLDSSKQDQSEAHSKVKEILARYKDATADRDAIQAKIDALDKGYESALSNLKAAFESYVHDVTESNKSCDASTKAAFDDFNKDAIALAKEISSKAAKYTSHNYKDQSAQEESIVRASIADSIDESRKLNAETTRAKDIAAHKVQTKRLDAAKLAKTHDIFKEFVENVDVLDGKHSTYVQDSSNPVKRAIFVYNDAAKQVGEKALDGFLSLFSHDAADDVIGSDLVAKAIVLQGEVAEHHIEIV